jgi:hypothetical protein
MKFQGYDPMKYRYLFIDNGGGVSVHKTYADHGEYGDNSFVFWDTETGKIVKELNSFRIIISFIANKDIESQSFYRAIEEDLPPEYRVEILKKDIDNLNRLD